MAQGVQSNSSREGSKALLPYIALLLLVLGFLFVRSLKPDEVVASNDGPYGAMVADQNRMPAIMTGLWADLNWLGVESPGPSPTISTALRLVTSPLVFSKVFCPFSLFVLGFCAWFCFRQWKLAPLACLLGGLAATLSSHFLSTACWGVAAQVICIGMNFVAIGLLGDNTSSQRWLKVLISGMAVGMGVMEGYDIGAIFSLYVAAFVIYQAFLTEGSVVQKASRGVLRLGLVGLCAAFLASHALIVLIGTQIKGVAGTEQTSEAKEQRWDFATQWSLPPSEVPQIIMPGLFGYRMDTPQDAAAFQEWFVGGAYWGAIGRDPGLIRAMKSYAATGKQGQPPQGLFRFSGGGEYASLLVVAIALWALMQSLRKKDSVFSLDQRRLIWFWGAAAAVSLLLAFGRYAPFYHLIYALPYFSTIRNPAKFTHPFHFSLVILFAYGVHGLSRRYLEAGNTSLQGLADHLKTWWAKANGFDKKWVRGSLAAFALSIVAWLIYASSRTSLEKHLQETGFGDPATAEAMAKFSVHAFGGFVLVLLITLALLTLVLSGWFAGKRARLAGALLGVFLVVDLARANLPWIIYWDYPQKYATNPVIDFLRERPYEKRVAIIPFQHPPQLGLLKQLYQMEWAQHHFPCYNIQSLDVIQMPRTPVDMVAFEGALRLDPTDARTTAATLPHITRRWQLTNTRYLLGPVGFLDLLNQQIDPIEHRFRVAQRFEVTAKPGISNPTKLAELTAIEKSDGNYALFEFTGALPRGKLYSNWQSVTNDQVALDTLASTNFNPAQTVIVANSSPPPAANGTNQDAGSVEFVKYAPKKVVLHAKATAPSVLLLNDRFAPNWKVSVDGKSETLLRCNYIMRGVQLAPGEHQIEFTFAPPITGLYISLAAIALGLLLTGLLVFSKPEQVAAEENKVLSKVSMEPTTGKK